MTELAELYAAVYATPDDDAPRAVLADALLERGDPRGELIALQLERARTGSSVNKRERSLLRTHGDAWCGGLRDFVSRDAREFERGFLASARGARKWYEPRDVEPAIGQPEWSTVHTLCAKSMWARERTGALVVALLGDPVMRSLRALYNISWRTAVALEQVATCPRLVTLGIDDAWFAEAGIAALGATGFGDVRHLALTRARSTDNMKGITRSPLWSRIEEISIDRSADDVGARLDWLVARTPRLQRIRVLDEYILPPRAGGWALCFTRAGTGFELDARFDALSHGYRQIGHRLALTLNQLAVGMLRAIRIAGTPAFQPGHDDLAQLRAACERHQPAVLELP